MIAMPDVTRARRALHAATAEEPDPLKGAIAGLAAGVIAALVMDGFEKVFLSKSNEGKESAQAAYPDNIPRYTPEAQSQPLMPAGHVSHEQSEGETATQKTAVAVAHVVGAELTKPQREAGGAAVHLGFGASVGAVYGALAEVTPTVSTGLGIPYGVAVWLLADETALSVLGLEKPPTQRSKGEHASMFLLHVVYGITLDLLRRGIRSLI